jgi:hypothetical protein
LLGLESGLGFLDHVLEAGIIPQAVKIGIAHKIGIGIQAIFDQIIASVFADFDVFQGVLRPAQQDEGVRAGGSGGPGVCSGTG